MVAEMPEHRTANPGRYAVPVEPCLTRFLSRLNLKQEAAAERDRAHSAIPRLEAIPLKFFIAELEKQAVDFDESLAPGSIEFVEDMRQVGELHTAGRADLLKEHRSPHEIVSDIRVRASLQTRVEILCARCLEPVAEPVNTSFDLLFRPVGIDGEQADRSITTSETEIGYYEGDGLLLEDVLREQILLALPTKTLCSEECKGLCPECGRNRNADPCNCASPQADPRWSSLQAFRSRVKS